MNSFIAITLLAVVGVAVAAPAKYGGHHEAVVPGPSVVHTYPAVAPVVKCGHNLLVSCDTHHQAVPCKAAAHGHGGYGHHAPAPAYHHAPAPAPSYHHAPAPAYHHTEHEQYRAKKHGKKHGKGHHHHAMGKSADNVGDAIDSSSEAM